MFKDIYYPVNRMMLGASICKRLINIEILVFLTIYCYNGD
jgi:hypothetical protein